MAMAGALKTEESPSYSPLRLDEAADHPSALLAVIVICTSLGVALLFCLGVCLILSCRKHHRTAGEPSPATFLVQKQKHGGFSSPAQTSSMTLLFPTISYSETGSEPCTPGSTLTPTDRPPLSWGTRKSTSPKWPSTVGALPVSWHRETHHSSDHAPETSCRWKEKTAGVASVSHADEPLQEAAICSISTGKSRSFEIASPATHPLVSPSKRRSLTRSERLWPMSMPLLLQPPALPAGCGLGIIRVRVAYSVALRRLRITVLSAHKLPTRFHNPETFLYTKVILAVDHRIRYTTPLVPASPSPAFWTTFKHSALPLTLAGSSVTFSVCQEEPGGRRVVVGSTSVDLSSLGITTALEDDIDSGDLLLTLTDSSPEQQVDCGGKLHVSVTWNAVAKQMTLSSFALSHVFLPVLLEGNTDGNEQTASVYLKLSIYHHGELMHWRRTQPVDLKPSQTDFGEDFVFCLVPSQLSAVLLVLSVRQKTGHKGGRRVLGSVYFGGCANAQEGKDHWNEAISSGVAVSKTHDLTH